MSRSLKKGPFVDLNLLKKIKALKPGERTVIKTWARDSVITPEMVGHVFGVHNGKNFVEVAVSEEMVGFKLGEFAPTRKFIRHGGRRAREEAIVTAEAEKVKLESVQKETGKKES
jgi:small subunit ribosomal protein S19